MLYIFGVPIFRDVLHDCFHRNLDPSTGFEAHPRSYVAAVADDGGYGGDRHDASRQHTIAHQRIQDGGFAALELTDASNVEAPLGYPLRQGARIGSDLVGF